MAFGALAMARATGPNTATTRAPAGMTSAVHTSLVVTASDHDRTSVALRVQASDVVTASTGNHGAATAWAVTCMMSEALSRPSLSLPPLILFPAAIAYAILRYRLLDTDVRVAQAVVYATLAGLSVAAYALILTGLSLILGQVIPANNPVAVGLTLFLLVILFNPLRERLQAAVDFAFFRGSRAHAQRLEELGLLPRE